MVRNGATLTFETVADNLYFGGRLIRSGREVVAVDRLGSVRWRRNLDTGATATFDYWPYGQEKPQATAQEREKFGTYYRDATGLDYADQRYYSSTSGRFLTADPFVTTTALRSPTRGWNRYAYVEGDPVNLTDPSGLCAVPGFCFEWPRFIPGFPGSPGGVAGGGNFYTGPNLEVPPDFQLGLQGDLATAYGPPVDWVTTTEARRLLDKRLEGFEGTNCDRVFGEVLTAAGIPYSAERLRQTAKRTNFYNVRDPAYANLTQHEVVGNNNTKTLNNSLPYGWSAYTIHGAAGAAVLLPKDWSVQPDVADRLLHEVFHALTEWSDRLVFEKFAKYGLVDTGQGTQDITDWIARDCKEKKR
jgi:RHS repeat-associated protein